MPDVLAWYEAHADEVIPCHEGHDPDALNVWLRPFLPGAPALAVDVGAGSGRDAAWLARLGHAVVAVEPTRTLREGAQVRHPDPRIRWVDDRLPDLDLLHAEGLRADALLLSAVWTHLPPDVRGRALTRLPGLFAPGGLRAITIRQEPADPERAMHPADGEEIAALAAGLPLAVLHLGRAEDAHRRAGVSWAPRAGAPDGDRGPDGRGLLPRRPRHTCDPGGDPHDLHRRPVQAREPAGMAGHRVAVLRPAPSDPLLLLLVPL